LIIESWNPGARRLYGYEAAEIVGRSERDLCPRGDDRTFDTLVATVDRCGHAVSIDGQRRRKDGSIVQISFCLAPLRERDGRLTGYAVVATDMPQRKAEERTRQLLLGELDHRVKNTLAIVQSIASQTLRRSESLADFEPGFSGRLRALSAAHNGLSETAWRGASVASLVRDQLALDGAGAERCSYEGPDVWLDSRATIRLALVLHELATNARKYGALSVPEGRVDLGWTLEAGEPVPVMRLIWREVDGPPIGPPNRRGFGSIVIEQSLSADGGRADMRFESAGLSCTFEVPLRHYTQDENTVQS
jgi:PAS domain S-box-containing protein